MEPLTDRQIKLLNWWVIDTNSARTSVRRRLAIFRAEMDMAVDGNPTRLLRLLRRAEASHGKTLRFAQ